jgi:hypothetical protein
MKKAWTTVLQLANAIGTFIGGMILFPHFANRGLYQSKVSIYTVTLFLIIVSYVLFSLINKRLGTRHNWIFATSGILCATALVLLLFLDYYPYVNRNVLDLQHECGGMFIRGDSVNYERLDGKFRSSYDSLSKNNPAGFVQSTNCDPSIAWTPNSIQVNFNDLFFRYCGLIFLCSFAIFFLIRGIITIP